jgi:hypothetical protein
MNQSRSQKLGNQIEWRRDKVLKLASDGFTEREIASMVKISQPTIHRDMLVLRRQAKEHMAHFVEQELPLRYRKCLVGLDGIIKTMSEIIDNIDSKPRHKIQAALVKIQAIHKIAEMIGNGPIIKEAVEFIDKYKEDSMLAIRKAQGNEKAYTFEELEQRRREAVF